MISARGITALEGTPARIRPLVCAQGARRSAPHRADGDQMPLSHWSCRGFGRSSPNSSRAGQDRRWTLQLTYSAISPRPGAMPSSVNAILDRLPSSPKATRRSSATRLPPDPRPSQPSTSPNGRDAGRPKTARYDGPMCCAPTPKLTPLQVMYCATATCYGSDCSARPRPCSRRGASTTAATWPFAATCSAPSWPYCSPRNSRIASAGTDMAADGATCCATRPGCRKSSLSRMASACCLRTPTTGVAGKLYFQAVGVAPCRPSCRDSPCRPR